MKHIFKSAQFYLIGLVFLLNSFSQLYSQGEQVNDRETIKISIDHFRVISTNPGFKSLKYKLPEAFAVKFIVNQEIKYIDKKQIISKAAKRLNIQTSVDLNVPLDVKVEAIRHAIKEMEVRFIVSGTVTEFNNKFRIEINIYDMNDQSTFKHNLGFYESDEIFKSINDLSKEAIAHIIHKPATKALRKMAVLPFSISGNTSCINSELLIENIGQSIYSDWKADEYEIIPWWKTDQLGYTDDKTELNKIGADAFVLGNVVVNCENNTIKVSPKIYLLAPDELIEMSEISTSSMGYDFIDQLIYDISDVSSSLVAPEGGWLYAPYLLKLNSYKEYLNLGIEYNKIKYYYLSSHFLLKACEVNPDNYMAKYYLSDNYEMRGNIEKAMESYLDLLKSFPDSLDPKFKYADLLLKSDKLEEARKVLIEIEETDPAYPGIYFMLGKTLMMQSGSEYSEETIGYFQKAIVQNPNNAQSYYSLGLLYYHENMNLKAQEMYTEAIKLDSTHVEAALALRRIKIDLATNAYQKARYSEQGTYSYADKMELYRSAEVYLLDAKKISEDEEVYELLRQVYINTSELDKAGLIVEEGIEKDYFDKYTYYRHAEDLRWYKDEYGNFAKTQLDESVDYFIKYLDADPFNPLTYRRIGSSYFRNKNYKQAEQNYNESLKRDSLDVTNYMNLAEVQLMIGEYEKARLNLEAVKKIGFKGRSAKELEQTREYLVVVSEALLKKSGWELKYNQLLKTIDNGEVEVTRWNFNTFQNWLNSENKYTKKIKPDIKKKINLLTNEMKDAEKTVKK